MFDVSFTELLVIGVVALVVIGPERLPKVARTLGHLVGRAQRYVNDVKTDIQREVELDELRKLKDQMQDAAQSVQSSLQNTESSLRKPLESLEQDVTAIKESLSHTGSDLVEPVNPEIPKSSIATATDPSPSSVAAASIPSFAEAEAQAMHVPDPFPTFIPPPEPVPVAAAPTQLELSTLAPTTAQAPKQTSVASSTPGSAS
jgi:sec-independent protein translocase protein TatB